MANCVVSTGNNAGVNIRASKSTGSTKLGVIANGKIVNIVRCDDTWATLLYNGNPAFAQHQYLSNPPTVNGDGLSKNDHAVCNANKVNIRSAAGGATTGKQMSKGKNVTIQDKLLTNNYYWYQIAAGQWVRGDFLTPGGNGAQDNTAENIKVGDTIRTTDVAVNFRSKSGGMVDALDSAEFSGSLIILLNEGVSFVKRNMKTRWKKTADSRVEMPDYCERSVFEALVNALIHRDYLILGSEVHIDIYDDRLTIYSPGGMADGTRIQERDLSSISSTRRNPVLADIFGRLGYMERQGSGFKKITETYRAAHNYRDELEPKFYSDASSFQVTLYNLNYGTAATANKVTIEDENVAIEVAIDRLNASQGTIAKAKAVFANMGADGVFGRSDIAAITKDSVTAAGNLITKLKNADLIEPVSGFGKGKYKFIAPKE